MILGWWPRMMLSFRISLLWSQKLRQSSLWVKSSTLLVFHEQIYHRISLAKLTNKLPMVALNYQTCILSLMKIFSPRDQLSYMMTDTLKSDILVYSSQTWQMRFVAELSLRVPPLTICSARYIDLSHHHLGNIHLTVTPSGSFPLETTINQHTSTPAATGAVNALFSVTSSSTGLQPYYKLAIACSSWQW